MARINIEMPEKFSFSTELTIRISDTNGGHMSNYAVLALINEARLQFLTSCGYSENCIIVTDAAIVYKAEAFYADVLIFEVVADDFNRYGCDINFRIRNKITGVDIAHAKTGMVYFDYEQHKVCPLPDAMRIALSKI